MSGTNRKPGRVAGPPQFGRIRHGGRGVRRSPGEMNGLESKYYDRLSGMLSRGEIIWFGFEPMTFKLAPDLRYTPDFALQFPDQSIELHEVKGKMKNKATGQFTFFAEGDAVIKIKVAAATMPFRFSIVYPLPDGSWGRKNYFDEPVKE